MCSNEERHLFVQRHPHLLSLCEQNRHPHLRLRRLNLHCEAPAEAAFQPVLNAFDLFWVGVAGDDDLLLRFGQCVEQVKNCSCVLLLLLKN